MSKTNTEAMTRLLNDLAANIGYTLIANPFDTPFIKESLAKIEVPDNNRFIWPVPVSNLENEVHKEFREQWIKYDVIDTVAELSFVWPSRENDHVAIILMDFNRYRRGAVKFIDATNWDLGEDNDMAAVCNMIVHDVFPGESHLAFNNMFEDSMDEELDDRWDEQVNVVSCMVLTSSLKPTSYISKVLPKEGFIFKDLEIKEDDSDLGYLIFIGAELKLPLKEHYGYGKIKGRMLHRNNLKSSTLNYRINTKDISEGEYEGQYYKLNGKAIVISMLDELNPTVVDTDGETIYVPLNNMAVITEDLDYDLEYVAWELRKDYVKKQLSYGSKGWLFWYNVKIEIPKNGIEEQKRIVEKERRELIEFYKNELSGIE